MDADGAALPFLHVNGQWPCLIMVYVDAACQGVALGIRQRTVHGVAAKNFCILCALLHSKHDVLYADVGLCAQADGECAADVLRLLWQVEADSVVPLPTLIRQRLVAVEYRAARAGECRYTYKQNGEKLVYEYGVCSF